jgi:hypothetical protein
VLPVVAEVVGVEESLVDAQAEIGERGFVSLAPGPLTIDMTVFPAVDGKGPEVVAFPAHRKLNDPV